MGTIRSDVPEIPPVRCYMYTTTKDGLVFKVGDAHEKVLVPRPVGDPTVLFTALRVLWHNYEQGTEELCGCHIDYIDGQYVAVMCNGHKGISDA